MFRIGYCSFQQSSYDWIKGSTKAAKLEARIIKVKDLKSGCLRILE